MLLLARTTPLDKVKKKSDGLSVFLVDLKEVIGNGLTVVPIRNMPNHETNELFFDDVIVPSENLIGEEGRGFRYILDGMNAERILIAAEVRWRWSLVYRKGDAIRTRTCGIRPSYWPKPRHSVSHRTGACECGSSGLDAI